MIAGSENCTMRRGIDRVSKNSGLFIGDLAIKGKERLSAASSSLFARRATITLRLYQGQARLKSRALRVDFLARTGYNKREKRGRAFCGRELDNRNTRAKYGCKEVERFRIAFEGKTR